MKTDIEEAELFDEHELRRALDRSHRRRVVVLVLLLVVVPLAVIGSVAAWTWWQLDPPGAAGGRVQVEVTKGWGVPEIANELSNRDVVGSSLFFQTYARLRGAGPFQAGTYTLRRHLGARGAVEVLEAGPTVRSVDLAVIPGKRLTEIAAEVNKQVPWLDGEEFLRLARSGDVRSTFEPEGSQSLEGLLWPDTYQVSEGETEEDVLRTMVRQFDKQATAAGLEGANVQGYGPYDIVKIASLIQSEAKVDKDRPLIASVIYNRLRDQMPLGIDAEVMYGVNKRTPPTRADLDTPGPYNSYLNKGLPPTPISGVTTASLLAALKPANTPYLYYVIGAPDGSHAFARTYEEHQANIEKARQQGLL